MTNDGSHEFRSCKRKKKYATETHVREIVASSKRKRDVELHCYNCRYCGCWHLTRAAQYGARR